LIHWVSGRLVPSAKPSLIVFWIQGPPGAMGFQLVLPSERAQICHTAYKVKTSNPEEFRFQKKYPQKNSNVSLLVTKVQVPETG